MYRNIKNFIAIAVFGVILLGELTPAQAQCNRIDSLESILPTLMPSKTRVDVLNKLAELYDDFNAPVALRYAQDAAIMGQKLKYEKGEAKALLIKGRLIYEINPNAIEELVADFYRAIDIYTHSKNKLRQAEAYEAYADFYNDNIAIKSNYLDSAILYYDRSYEIYEKLYESKSVERVASHLAGAYLRKGDEQKAIEFAKKSGDTNAEIIEQSLSGKLRSESYLRNILIVGIVFAVLLVLLLFKSIYDALQSNRKLEAQKEALDEKNSKIEQQKRDLEQQAQELKEKRDELQLRNKEVEKQSKELILASEQVEMRNVELSEKNEELKQLSEEIMAQRDNIGKQADTLAQQQKETEEYADALRKSNETITILSRIGQNITSSLNTKEIYDTLYGYLTQLMPAEGFMIVEYAAENNMLEFRYISEQQHIRPLHEELASDQQNPLVWCIRRKRSLILNRPEDFEQYGVKRDQLNSAFNAFIFYPMIVDSKVIGVVSVQSEKIDAYDLSHLDILKTLASYTAIAIQNAETYEKLNAAQEQLVESEKMAALGNLVAGVAHEINTPVGICVTASSRLSSKTREFAELFQSGEMKRKDLKEYLETVHKGNKIILTNATRAADLVQGFKRVAVEQSNENKRQFNLSQYLRETITALNPEFKNKPFEVELDVPEQLEIDSYPGAFSQIITNLCMNSLIHGFKGREQGKILIKARPASTRFVLEYSDDGNGMSEEVKERVFEPFFTTNREGGGSGLGMNIVYNLVQKIGGKLNIHTAPNEGVKLVFDLPIKT